MSSEVIREYLFKLGYSVDKTSENKTKTSSKAMELGMKRLSVAFLAVGAAAVAMVGRFSSQMDALYHASRRADSSANNLQALEYAAERVGIQGGRLTDILGGLNDSLQLDPGKKGMIEAMGIDTAQDKAQVLVKLMEKLFSMNDTIGAKFAGDLLGMSQQEYLQLKRNRSEFYKAVEDKQRAQQDSGVDMDKAAEAGHRYANALKNITDRLATLRDILSVQMVGPFESVAKVVEDSIERMTRVFTRWTQVSAAFGKGWQGLKNLLSGDKSGLKDIREAGEDLSYVMSAKELSKGGQAQAGEPRKTVPGLAPSAATTAPATTAPAPASPSPLTKAMQMIPQEGVAFARAAADRLQVPIEFILAQLRNEVGPKMDKAIGKFNFGNIKAGKNWGGDTEEKIVHEYDKAGNKFFMKSAFRSYKTPEEGGKDFADLITRMYPKAIGAKTPEEFAKGLQMGVGGRQYATDPKYAEKVAANAQALNPTIQNTTTFNITGSDPKSIASSVAGMQDRVNADSVRYMRGDLR